VEVRCKLFHSSLYNSIVLFALIYISKTWFWPLRSLEPAYPNNLNLIEKEVLQCLTLTFALVCGRCSAESCWASWGQCSQCALQRPPQAAAFFSYWHFPSCPHSLHQYSQAEWRRPLGGGTQWSIEPGHLTPYLHSAYSATAVIFWLEFLVVHEYKTVNVKDCSLW